VVSGYSFLHEHSFMILWYLVYGINVKGVELHIEKLGVECKFLTFKIAFGMFRELDFHQRRLDTYAARVIACFTFLPQQPRSHVNMAWDQG